MKKIAYAVRSHWRLKLLLMVAVNAVFWSGYSYLGRHAFFPVRAVPKTWLDVAVPYEPFPWALVYLSQFTFTGALPWLLATRAAIRRYSIGLITMVSSSFLIFLFLPTECVRPAEIGDHRAMQFIIAYDGHLNAFPSLHAAFLAYMIALAWRLFGRSAPRLFSVLCVTWGAAILYATLATKQHHVIDLAAGGVIGLCADWIAWRGARAAATIPVSNDSGARSGVR